MNTEKVGTFNLEKQDFVRLSKRSQYRIVFKIFFIYVLFAGCAVLATSSQNNWFLVLCPMMGFVMAGFINAAHDCVHNNQLSGRRLNRVMGAIWCTPVLINFSIYRYKHLVHHARTGMDGDTEPATTFKSIYSYLRFFFAFHAWLNLAKGSARILKLKFPSFVTKNEQKRQIVADNFAILCWFVAMIALTVFFPKALFFSYWLPLLFFPPMLFIFTLPEHYACHRGDLDLRTNTRSIRSNWFVRFFQWNANFHAEHHAYPSIPATNLSLLNKKIGANFVNNEDSYFMFHLWVVKNLLRKFKKSVKEQEIKS